MLGLEICVGISVGLQNGDLKTETESPIVAAQNESIRTNLVKPKIDKNPGRFFM